MSEEQEGSLLVVVIDINQASAFKNNERGISKCLNGIIVLCNSHLMLSSNNKLAVIACDPHQTKYLYPNPFENEENEASPPNDGQYEVLKDVGDLIHVGIQEMVGKAPSAGQGGESLIAGAICLALSFVNRNKLEHLKMSEKQSRILVLTSGGDSASQYMNFMNCFFSSRKLGVTIDVCILKKDSGILQQGCDITGGIYLKVSNVEAFVEYLLWVFLPDVKTRKELVLPNRVHVDYRAACFCHRNLIEIGYVCSVCLSIFCAFSPICSTCQTAFKFMGPMNVGKQKKKKARISM